MGKKNPPPDERVVYLALKNLFKGQNADIRQQKAVRKVVNSSLDHEDVAGLVREHNLDVVCNSARTLLSENVFASTLKAKMRFPELFDLSPSHGAEKEASEIEAARHEADAIRQVLQDYPDNLDASEPVPDLVKEPDHGPSGKCS